MKRREYLLHKTRLEGELAKAQAEVNSISEQLRALEIVFHQVVNRQPDELENPIDIQDCEDSRGEGQAVNKTETGRFRQEAVGDLTREIAMLLDGEFSVPEVVEQIVARQQHLKESNINRTTVSGRLRRMEQAGELELVRRGKGPLPSVYRKKSRILFGILPPESETATGVGG